MNSNTHQKHTGAAVVAAEASPPIVRHPRTLSKASLAAVMATVALLTAGCGGGGGDTPPAPSPSAPTVEPPAVASVPDPVYDDPRRTSAFERLNQVRAQAGLGKLTQNKLIDVAAQAHSQYLILNNAIGHEEISGAPGYYEGIPSSRLGKAGFSDFVLVSEVAAPLIYANGVPEKSGADLIDTLIATPYHRNGMLRPQISEAGFGVYHNGIRAALTADMTYNEKNIQGAPKTPYIIWPVDGAVDIATTMPPEIPNPIPENGNEPAGYPVSLQTNIDFRGVDATVFEIHDTSLGNDPIKNLVPTKLLTYKNNTSNGDHAFTAALPRSPLKKNTRYTVKFRGNIISDGKEDTPLEKEWSFTTGNKDYF